MDATNPGLISPLRYPSGLLKDIAVEGPGSQIQSLALIKGDDNVDFWWRSAGFAFAVLLSKAGYSSESQCRNLLFFYYVVCPALGKRPAKDGRSPAWRSFMTDDFSPIELSWEWASGAKKPTVRFSIEPIGPLAGTVDDPFNCSAALELVNRHRHLLLDCDLSWFNHFLQLASFAPCRAMDDGADGEQGHQSRIFLAFDIFEASIMLKAYFIPTFRAIETGESVQDSITQAITSLPGYQTLLSMQYNKLTDFMANTTIGASLVPEIIAIDCIKSVRSRVKLYMRTRCTSFASLCQIMCMSEDPAERASRKIGLLRLKRLWHSVLGLAADFSESEELPMITHRTAGILYYFELRPGQQTPTCKVYIPVRHYARNDRIVAEGLTQCLDPCSTADQIEAYNQALQILSSGQSLDQSSGMHTYIGCSIVGEELKVTSYLSPQCFTRYARLG